MSDATKFFLGLLSVVFGVVAVFAGSSMTPPNAQLTIAGIIAIAGGVVFWVVLLSTPEKKRQPKRSSRRRQRDSDTYQRPSGAHILREDIDSHPAPRPLARYDRPNLEEPAEYHPRLDELMGPPHPSCSRHSGPGARLTEALSQGRIPRRLT